MASRTPRGLGIKAQMQQGARWEMRLDGGIVRGEVETQSVTSSSSSSASGGR